MLRHMNFFNVFMNILHPEGLDLRLGDSNERPVVLITSLTLEQLFPRTSITLFLELALL
jgi:hypothetical protein